MSGFLLGTGQLPSTHPCYICVVSPTEQFFLKPLKNVKTFCYSDHYPKCMQILHVGETSQQKQLAPNFVKILSFYKSNCPRQMCTSTSSRPIWMLRFINFETEAVNSSENKLIFKFLFHSPNFSVVLPRWSSRFLIGWSTFLYHMDVFKSITSNQIFKLFFCIGFNF